MYKKKKLSRFLSVLFFPLPSPPTHCVIEISVYLALLSIYNPVHPISYLHLSALHLLRISRSFKYTPCSYYIRLIHLCVTHSSLCCNLSTPHCIQVCVPSTLPTPTFLHTIRFCNDGAFLQNPGRTNSKTGWCVRGGI